MVYKNRRSTDCVNAYNLQESIGHGFTTIGGKWVRIIGFSKTYKNAVEISIDGNITQFDKSCWLVDCLQGTFVMSSETFNKIYEEL